MSRVDRQAVGRACRLAYALALAAVAFARPAAGQRVPSIAGGGAISGTVLDLDSRPLPSARVEAHIVGSRIDGLAIGAEIPWAETDALGKFTIKNLRWGRYSVWAGKPSAGYPAPNLATFYTADRAPIVALSFTVPAATTTIRLGAKPGVLRGKIVAADTGSPIGDAGADLRISTKPRRSFSTSLSPAFELFLPANESVSVAFSAPGFSPWQKQFRLKAAEQKRLIVRLQRIPARPP